MLKMQFEKQMHATQPQLPQQSHIQNELAKQQLN